MTNAVNSKLTEWQIAPGFEDRVKEAFEGANVRDIAAKIGENYHTVRNWIKLTRDAPPQFFIAVAELTNHSPYWLLTAKGPKLLPSEFSLAKKRVQPDPELAAQIRNEVLEALSLVLMTEKDRAAADSLIEDLRRRLRKEGELK